MLDDENEFSQFVHLNLFKTPIYRVSGKKMERFEFLKNITLIFATVKH